MKSKRFYNLLILLIVICMSVTYAFNSVAFAADDSDSVVTYSLRAETVTERVAYEHTFNYIIAKDTDGKSVTFDATKVSNFKAYKSDSSYAKGQALDDGVSVKFDASTGKIEYYATLNENEYYIVEFNIKDYNDNSGTAVLFSVKVKTLKKADGGLCYKDFSTAENKTLLANVRADVAKAVVNTDTSYTIPVSVKDLITSEYYNVSDLKYYLYYSIPTSGYTSSTSTSGTLSTISTSSTGKYLFFILYEDDDYNTVNGIGDISSVSKIEEEYNLGTDGLYLKSDTSYSNLIIPVFSFEVNKTSAIKIETSGGTEEGFINYVYDDVSFTITNGGTTVFVLKYCPLDKDNEADSNWVDAVAYEEDEDDSDDNNADVADAKFDADNFSSSSLSFTPLKKGYFKFICYATGANGSSATANLSSNIVKVEREYTEVKIVDQRFVNFVKGNWKSLIFLGIALLSLIGIVVLIFVPNKKEEKISAKVKVSVKGDETVEEEIEDKNSDAAEDVSDKEEEEVNEDTSDKETEDATEENEVSEEKVSDTEEKTEDSENDDKKE